MPIELTKKHLTYMNIGEKYWGANRKNLNSDQEKSLSKYLNKLDESIRRGIGLFLWGDNNVGKSYLTALICKQAWGLYRVTSYCVTAAELKESWAGFVPAHPGSEESMASRVLHARFLVVDDLGKEYRTQSGFSETNFGVLLRTRVRSNKVTCITTNLSPKEFTDVYGISTGQLAKECMFPVRLQGPDMRTLEAEKIMAFLEG